MSYTNMRFSLFVLVLCLGFASDAVSAPSVRVLGSGNVGYATSGSTGLTSTPGVKATAVNTANRVNTSVLGTTGGASKKSASVKIGSTPAATAVQPVVRTANSGNTSRIGSVSANAVKGTGRIPAVKVQNKIQTTYRPVQTVSTVDTGHTVVPNEVDLSNYYTKPEIDDMRTGYYTKPEIDDLLDGLDLETVTNLTELINNHEQTLQQINQESNTIYNVKTEQRESVYVVDKDDFDYGMFGD